MSEVVESRNELPTARIVRTLRELAAAIEELNEFAVSFERAREVDPASHVVAASMGSLYARLARLTDEARSARDLAGFYVRFGREVD